MPDYYRRLGIVAGATDAQVQRAVRRYWQRVARFRPAGEQPAFLEAAAVLGNYYLRAVYDPAYQPAANLREALRLRSLSAELRTRLHQEQARGYRLEQEVRRLRGELAHALSYPETMADKRQERRRWWYKLLLLLLLPVAYGLLRGLGDNGAGLTSLSGPPYQPVAQGTNWLIAQRDSMDIYTQAEQMPQFPGGAKELRGFLRQGVGGGASKQAAERLWATGQLRFVVDSAGRAGSAQVLGLPAADSAGRQLLRQAAAQLPRFVPGYQRAHPVAVRLTVPLAE